MGMIRENHAFFKRCVHLGQWPIQRPFHRVKPLAVKIMVKNLSLCQLPAVIKQNLLKSPRQVRQAYPRTSNPPYLIIRLTFTIHES